jgi:hypothetical protein
MRDTSRAGACVWNASPGEGAAFKVAISMRRLADRMRRFHACAVCIVFWSSLLARGQEPKEPGSTIQDARIVRLAPLIYPALARQTGVAGEVELKLEIRPDGGISSAAAISGHPLLVQPALDNALKSQFVCENCGEDIHVYRLIYIFRLSSPDMLDNQNQGANPEHPSLRVEQGAGRVIVTDYPFQEIDFGSEIRKARSIKCLYLWKCGFRERDFSRPSHFKERE